MRNELEPQEKKRLWFELGLVAALSLGQSAVYAIVRLADITTRGPISDAQAKLNTSMSPRPGFDLVYQILDIGFTLVPVLLALYLLTRDSNAPPLSTRLGVNGQRGKDLGRGTLIFTIIGIGTLAVYAGGRALGITAEVQPANLGDHWWTIPVLILAAAKNGIVEEVIIFGFGAERLQRLGCGMWPIIISLAVLRASYHLYQGIGPFIGNVAMGIIFGWYFMRRGRLMPLVWAHFIIDAVGFLAPGILTLVDIG
ncbi:CPBP family intramembrane glutamic endopeptidase [Brevibacterium sp. UCMA 11754]|uniref:CPBP family intramembrane glutamic endopeptidase n=1 Tax=Brevibacterium sp. UCMA 11754 TaxID=2749198 RepID=UPI001F41FE04|nr:CPBP family intramembrane glutamic endopeptidase [Brevibacterium sp. UCMA 11754]MCF2571588.1 CPBP family intramembrane metalloprotease [Brevibacterium sp. UCMA 11754]MCF2574559.1 CPBP family intramembrane metalloprotease [Brevibacterium sp. UCMA 11754]MCF2574565.1 CPBP family intramembrane metalloprotease [Brevibacterium sp. UCMA 11754]